MELIKHNTNNSLNISVIMNCQFSFTMQNFFYFLGYNLGCNVVLARNFAPQRWIKKGVIAIRCECPDCNGLQNSTDKERPQLCEVYSMLPCFFGVGEKQSEHSTTLQKCLTTDKTPWQVRVIFTFQFACDILRLTQYYWYICFNLNYFSWVVCSFGTS